MLAHCIPVKWAPDRLLVKQVELPAELYYAGIFGIRGNSWQLMVGIKTSDTILRQYNLQKF